MPLCSRCKEEAESSKVGVAETPDEDPREDNGWSPKDGAGHIPKEERSTNDDETDADTIDASVWRLRWEMNGVAHYTAWTAQYDLIRNLREDYRKNWPGCGVEVEAATVTDVSEPRTMDFGGGD